MNNHEQFPPKILNLLTSISGKLAASHEGALSPMLQPLAQVLAEAFGDLDYQVTMLLNFLSSNVRFPVQNLLLKIIVAK